MTILVLGRSGQVATALLSAARKRGLPMIAWGRADLNLNVSAEVHDRILGSGASAIINAAAYTAVDKAEDDEAAAMRLNAEAPGIMARASQALSVPFIHISSDYVFSGDKAGAYVEDDRVDPLSAYGRSKAAGEAAVMANNPAATILRTAWVFHESGGNFVKTMLRLGQERPELRVVADQHGNPTYAGDIAEACLDILALDTDKRAASAGVFHFAGRGDTTWHGFAQAIFEKAATLGLVVPHNVLAITTSDYPTPAKRPANSRFDCSRIQEKLGLAVPAWDTSLEKCLTILARNTS